MSTSTAQNATDVTSGERPFSRFAYDDSDDEDKSKPTCNSCDKHTSSPYSLCKTCRGPQPYSVVTDPETLARLEAFKPKGK